MERAGTPVELGAARRIRQAEPEPGGQLDIEPHQHVAITGYSQCGKTTLLRHLARPVASRVVIAVKPEDWGPDWGVVSREPEAILYHPQVVWCPPLREIRHPDPKGRDSFTRGLAYLFEQRGDPNRECGVTVVVDEMVWVAPLEPHELMEVLVCMGMGRGIGMWGATQRNARVYRNWFSEAVWALSFRLRLARDRWTLANDLGIDCDLLATLDDHAFVVARQNEQVWRGPVIGDR